MTKTKAKRRNWRHVGGGTLLVGKSHYRCDDQYYNGRLKQNAFFQTTTKRHADMPQRVVSLSEIESLPGCRLISVDSAED